MTERPYFEDLTVGDTRSFGEYHVTEAEILEFAEQYDPQPFHVDVEAAEESFFGGLVASGWHTSAMTMRMLVDNFLTESRSVAALGVDEIRWPRPVRPGDTLSVRTEVDEKLPWGDGMGLVISRVTTETDDGDTVMTMLARVLWDAREDGD